jgi:N-acyl-D-aspartate/D-glutamate deacylase
MSQPRKETSAAGSQLLIRGGTVVDGTGTPARKADVLITGDRIARIGTIKPSDAKYARIIDATGKVVTPGFIDAHSHADPLQRPECDNFLAMGVTTVCLGQDGESPKDLATWMKRVEAIRPGNNVVMFVGHGTVRDLARIGLQRDPSPKQLAAMQSLVRKAMDQGCFGLTTGLEYQPGSFANLEELVAIAKPVAAAGGLVMSHMRSEDADRIPAALSELLNQGRGSGCAVHVSHIKIAYGHGAEQAEAMLGRMQAARDDGIPVTADIYPYNASYTGIGIVFPEWAKPPHDYADVVRTRRDELADYLRRRVTLRNGPEATLFGTGPWAGKTLADAAAEAGKPFEDVLIDDIGLNGARAAYFVMDPALQQRLLIDSRVMISSDGSATSRHPRGHGAFARVIREFVVKRKVLTLEEAVRKMTGLTAETIGLDRLRRGRLAEGWAADVLVFDPGRVRDNATYETPHLPATGFDWVIVNGQIVRATEKPTGVRAGRVLKRQTATTLRAKIDTLFEEYDHPDRPGATVAVICDGKLVVAEGFGLANLETREPAGRQTNYRLASITKQFTAMCIVLLKERGLLSYDDPIIDFFPEFPDIGKQITVRHLLGHTSGVIAYEDIIPEGQVAQLTDRDVLTLVKTQRGAYFTPGSSYRYSNSGYALLALIVERVSGQSFATFLRKNIFDPLGMEDSVAFENGVSTVRNRAMGYRREGPEFVNADQNLTSAVLGDGGIYMSVEDYARWDQALYGTELVDRDALKHIFTPGRLSDGTPTIYGLGWRIEHRKGHRVVHHNGGTCGFDNAVRRVPDERFTIVVLTNRRGKQARRIADELLDWMLDQCETLAAAPPTRAASSDKIEWQWHDASTLCVEGKGWNDPAGFYQRLPKRAEGTVPDAVWRLSHHTAGLCVRFITNSTRIAATWDGGGAMNHMAATGNSGLDLYGRRHGEWVFAGVGRPRTSRTTATLARDLSDESTEYLLYLPLYNDVTELRVGVEPGAMVCAAPDRSSRPIVFYGTSITQGGCAARAGMCHPAILGRHLDREVINLGFSGSGKMEPEMAILIGELDPALFVLECLPNMTPDLVRDRVAPFVRHLRKVRPATPILLVESPLKPGRNPGNELLREIHDDLTASGVQHLHYLPGESLLAGTENGTVDGAHPTDLGFLRMATAYEPVLRRILKDRVTARPPRPADVRRSPPCPASPARGAVTP